MKGIQTLILIICFEDQSLKPKENTKISL